MLTQVVYNLLTVLVQSRLDDSLVLGDSFLLLFTAVLIVLFTEDDLAPTVPAGCDQVFESH